MQQQPRRSDLAAASWANSPPPRRSKTPPTQRASPRQAKAVPASPASPPPAAPVTPTKRPSIPSPRKSTPRRSSSPGGSSPRVRPTYGTEAYTAQHLKNKALLVDDGLKDPHTSQLSSLQDVDARCALLVNQHVWVGERDGSITLRNQSGDVAHIIERKKGSFVWCLIEVHHHVWAGCSDGFIRVLDSATHAMVAQFARHAGGGGGVHSLTFHAPTNTVFSGSNDFDILAWNATTFDFLLQFHQHGGAVRALAADANHLYSASDDSTIIKWDLSTNQAIQVWPGHSKGVHSLCITDRHLWSGSEDGTIRIWDRATGECIGVANCITGSVDSLLVVGPNVWSAAGSTICIWDSLHLRLLGTYTAHEGYVTTLAIVGKTSNYLVWSAGSDHKAQVWNTLAPTDDASAELKRQIFELSAAAQASRRQAEQLQAELRTKAEEHEALCAEKESAKKKAEELDRKIGLLQKITASLGVNTDDASLASFQGTARPETSPPPTGTVMITFTDVQSSTELWEHFTEDMEKAIAIHNVVMRDGIEKFNGYEVKTEGDAFMCSWHTSLDAVRWCLYMQTKLLETDWPKSLLAHSSAQTERGRTSVIWHGLRVRMGGHVGQPSCQRDPNTGRMDYFGRMVNKSARVGGLGKGGQIVVSDDVLKDLSQYGDVAALLENPVIVNLGERKLKGIAEPTVVHSLVPHPLRERKFPVEEAAAAAAGAAAGEEIMQVEGDHAGDGSKAKSIQYLIFMDRLKKRIKEFPDDIHKLQDELRSAAEAADWLRKALDDSEGSKGELRSRVASLESTNHELTQQAAQHAAQLAAAQLENDRLQARLRAVDEMFKSRLSLLTDVFKLYKKAEGARRADPNVEAVVGEFKSVIHRHYTDDELAHLGSSRHLIAPAGAAGAGSPHSARRSASPESKPRH